MPLSALLDGCNVEDTGFIYKKIFFNCSIFKWFLKNHLTLRKLELLSEAKHHFLTARQWQENGRQFCSWHPERPETEKRHADSKCSKTENEERLEVERQSLSKCWALVEKQSEPLIDYKEKALCQKFGQFLVLVGWIRGIGSKQRGSLHRTGIRSLGNQGWFLEPERQEKPEEGTSEKSRISHKERKEFADIKCQRILNEV